MVFYAARLAEEKKAADTEILEMKKLGDLADYLIITSGASYPQLKAIAKHVEEGLSAIGLEPSYKEGKYGDRWFLLDYLDFIVNIIEEDAREFYSLEELWSKALFIPRDEWTEE